MKILMLTNEYPPHIYGGAGVHVDHLVRELENVGDPSQQLQVICFGDQAEARPGLQVTGIGPGEALAAMNLRHPKLLDTLQRNLIMAGSARPADIIHCHTWYTHLAGCLTKQLLEIPLVVTAHSLEPLRPWKKEQLGNGYCTARWLEESALSRADRIIAVSKAMQNDIGRHFQVDPAKVASIPNGIDTRIYRPAPNGNIIKKYAIDPSTPMLLFVGRVTRQKGIPHLLRALHDLEERVQLVLCAGLPDTAEYEEQISRAVALVRSGTRHQVIWLREMLPQSDLVALYSQAALFVCPSVYEPFGIINLEAMACGTPVVAAAVGGIPEVVIHGETGLLVPLEAAGETNSEPKDPQRFARDLAAALAALLKAPEQRAAMGAAARRHVETHFSWQRIARRTLALYQETIREHAAAGKSC